MLDTPTNACLPSGKWKSHSDIWLYLPYLLFDDTIKNGILLKKQFPSKIILPILGTQIISICESLHGVCP